MNICRRTGMVQGGKGAARGGSARSARTGSDHLLHPPDFGASPLLLALVSLRETGAEAAPLEGFANPLTPSGPHKLPVEGGQVETVPSDPWETRSCRGCKITQGQTLDGQVMSTCISTASRRSHDRRDLGHIPFCCIKEKKSTCPGDTQTTVR